MAGRSGGLLSAGLMVVLSLGGSACDYDRSSAPNGPGYGDTANMSAVVGRSDFRVITATGDIAATVAEFRTVLGDPLNGSRDHCPPAGEEVKVGRAAPADMPGDFFNTTVKAGALFSTDGTGFRNSDADFSEINPAYADDFNAFSPLKTFMPLGSAEVTTEFGAGFPDPGGGPWVRGRVLRRRAARGGIHQALRRPWPESRPVPRTGPERCIRVFLRRRGVRFADGGAGPDHVGPAGARGRCTGSE